ncbi:uncharacterized protein LOC119178584 isoform X1 [Rhipicephalus microplus]|uniref:uncharacterized protein LOC119178584 isoform X1 n=1 Tax=Rhipicephalus microplus TaxID=6941 RepID=UPI003F6A7BEB
MPRLKRCCMQVLLLASKDFDTLASQTALVAALLTVTPQQAWFGQISVLNFLLSVQITRCAARLSHSSKRRMRIIKPTSLAIGVLVIVTLAHTGVSNFPERKPYLSDHQDAWRAMLQDRPFVLYQRSFEHDAGFSGDQKCIQGIMLEFYPEEKYAVGVVHWLLSKYYKVNATAYLFSETTEGYRIPNAYALSLNSGMASALKHGTAFSTAIVDCSYSTALSMKTLDTQYTFVASEYDNCDILRVRHQNNGCELWSLIEKVNEISSLCHFIYDLLCGPEKYMIYDPETCGNVPLWLQ